MAEDWEERRRGPGVGGGRKQESRLTKGEERVARKKAEQTGPMMDPRRKAHLIAGPWGKRTVK